MECEPGEMPAAVHRRVGTGLVRCPSILLQGGLAHHRAPKQRVIIGMDGYQLSLSFVSSGIDMFATRIDVMI